MRCPYCYNPEIVLGKGKKTWADAVSFLNNRKGLLEGVVLSGGECTLHKKIVSYIEEIKDLGFAVKIDTNGSRPEILKELCERKLIDYVALDFKAMKNSYKKVTESNLYHRFESSLSLLLSSQTLFEVRTTVHSDLISKLDLLEMRNYLERKGYRGKYFIQYFVEDTSTLGNLGKSKRHRGLEEFNNDAIQICVRN